jgi:hypothetical protein
MAHIYVNVFPGTRKHSEQDRNIYVCMQNITNKRYLFDDKGYHINRRWGVHPESVHFLMW